MHLNSGHCRGRWGAGEENLPRAAPRCLRRICESCPVGNRLAVSQPGTEQGWDPAWDMFQPNQGGASEQQSQGSRRHLMATYTLNALLSAHACTSPSLS